MDMSDDVSALSMDGASAIAGKIFARRLRNDFAEMTVGIPEHEAAAAENDRFDANATLKKSPSTLLLEFNDHNDVNNDGEELIEPFPKSFEEWQKKKKEKKHKHKHKSKKHHKSSSKGSGSRRSKDSKSRKKEEKERREREATVGSTSSEGKAAPPIMEISIQSTTYEPRHSDHPRASDPPSDRSSMASTASPNSHNGNYHHYQQPTVGSSSLNGSGGGSGSPGRANIKLKRSLNQRTASTRSLDVRSSIVTADSRENTSHAPSHVSTGQSHATGQSSCANSRSNVTEQDVEKLVMHLERSRNDERQVLEIHRRLEDEVRTATGKAAEAKERRRAIELQLASAAEERERLRGELREVQDECNVLRTRLRRLEDRETEEGLDDVLDSMEAKIKALKTKGRRNKDRAR